MLGYAMLSPIKSKSAKLFLTRVYLRNKPKTSRVGQTGFSAGS